MKEKGPSFESRKQGERMKRGSRKVSVSKKKEEEVWGHVCWGKGEPDTQESCGGMRNQDQVTLKSGGKKKFV